MLQLMAIHCVDCCMLLLEHDEGEAGLAWDCIEASRNLIIPSKASQEQNQNDGLSSAVDFPDVQAMKVW